MRPRDVLAENLKKLMAASPKLATFPQITKAGGGANGTLDRIRRKSIATGVDNLEPLAEVYGLDAWQLLVPTLTASAEPSGLPRVSGMPEWPFPRIPLKRFLALSDEDRGYVQGKLEQAIEACEAKQPHAGKNLTRAKEAVSALTDQERLELLSAIMQPGLPDAEVEKRIPATQRKPVIPDAKQFIDAQAATKSKKPSVKKSA
jgi:hypothetical protein